MNKVVLTSIAVLLMIHMMFLLNGAAARASDGSLILHYDFSTNPGQQIIDLSGKGHNGLATDVTWLNEAHGRRGAMRLDGKTSHISIPPADSLKIDGDMTLELWMRLNAPITNTWGNIFSADDGFSFTYAYHGSSLVLYYRTRTETLKYELTAVPFDKHAITSEWSHIALVMEYPRCRLYVNGKMAGDAYIPVAGMVGGEQTAPRLIGSATENAGLAMDLSSVKLYRRALGSAEIAAHAQGEKPTAIHEHEILVEPDWYKDLCTVRVISKGQNRRDQRIVLELRDPGTAATIASVPGRFVDQSGNGSGRYVATSQFQLSKVKSDSINIVAREGSAQGAILGERLVSIARPAWVHTAAGRSEQVPAPWTALQVNHDSADNIGVAMWGRQYHFGASALLRQIETKNESLLTGPVTLTATANGQSLDFGRGEVRLKDATDGAVAIEQVFRSTSASFRVESVTEYDGFTLFDCTFLPGSAIELQSLRIDIPVQSKFATLGYGDRTLPLDPNVPISEWFSGAIKGDLAFRFGPVVWIGNETLGLSWQAESNEHWRNSDPQRAIEILPRGETTYLRLNFVDAPTSLKAREPLRYRFALLATPVKPLAQEAWEWRIARSEPYGADLNLPDRKAASGQPALAHYHAMGIRRLFVNVLDEWPWPLPSHPQFQEALYRLNETAHAHGMKVHPYLIHQRVPVMVPEFDGYGMDMVVRPIEQYVEPGSLPGSARPGPLGVDWGANSQGALFMCPKSQALQDAYMHSLADRLRIYGDDGIYLDGTVHVGPLCENTVHGCGYRDADGRLHGTYSTFSNRELMKRIYTVVKQHDPDAIVDVHCSWGYNPASLAYADVIWNGEQWFHLQSTGAPKGHMIDVLSLEQFRAEFTGLQLGVAAETLTYRLGKPMQVAAISLLHDISPRLSTGGFDNFAQSEDPYYALVPDLWKLRDAFGATQARKLYYYENGDYVTVTGDKCYATLLHHPHNGVLALISNLSPQEQAVNIELDLEKLGLPSTLNAFDPLRDQPVAISADGNLTITLGSEDWIYIWIRPASHDTAAN